MDKTFLKNYYDDFIQLVQPNEKNLNQLILLRDKILEVNSNGRKTLIFGNGGSAAMASHFSVDLTKNAKVKSINFNEADLITCFSNDYGFENWISKAMEFYGNEGDLLIASEKVTEMVELIETEVAESAGEVDETVGAVVSSVSLVINPLEVSY